MSWFPSFSADTQDPEGNSSRPRTRSHTAALQIPTVGIARGTPGNRSRSPSPLPPGGGNQFFPPRSPTPGQFSMADTEAMRILAESAAASAAAQASTQTAAALQNLNLGKKRPELPTFDHKNIEIWIRRTESAYIRAGINRAIEKFAFLENKIAVDFDPRINEFLYGDPSDENWAAFLAYLRLTYGKTRRQEASSILDGTRRDGRRPSQLLAKIKEKAGRATLDDIFKELVLRELPQSVRHSLVDRVEEMSAQQTAELADRYFDQEGRQLNPPNSVSAVTHDPPSEARRGPVATSMEHQDVDEDTDVNALGARPKSRFPPKKSFTPAFGGGTGNSTRGGFNHQSRSNNNNNNKPHYSSQPRGKPSLKSVCHRHVKYGEETKFCEPGCLYWNKMSKAGNDAAGWQK